MNNTKTAIKSNGFAPLQNMALMQELAITLRDRKPHLPGIGVFYGPSGFGKTMASIYTTNKTSAVRIEIGETWTAKRMLQAIYLELGGTQIKATTDVLAQKVIDSMSNYPDQPLIVDEADKLLRANGKMLEIVREISDHSTAPVILIGEERLPQDMAKFERVHNRVLKAVAAQMCDFDDARMLAETYCEGLTIADDLIEKIRLTTNGRARRIATTLEAINTFALNNGLTHVSAADYDGEIVSGETPKTRRVGK